MKKLFLVLTALSLTFGSAYADYVVLESELAPYAKSTDVPTDMSDLNDDVGYATSNTVSDIARNIAKEVVDEMTSVGWEVDGTYYRLVVESFVPPPPAETTFTLAGGAEQTYDIVGALDQQWMIDHGYYADGAWVKTINQAEIGTNVTNIGDGAFYSCSSLASITIPDSVTSIGHYAFKNCSLTSVDIPASVTSIPAEAFYGCAFTNITVPGSVASIGADAFRECPVLTSVTIGDGVTSIGQGAFQSCSNLTSVTISDSVTSIGNYVFQRCPSLMNVTIPNSVTNIGERVFRYCSSLTSLTIPSSVTSIGVYVFSGCNELTSVTMSGKTTTQVSGMANYSWGLPSGCVITCSDGTLTVP